MLAQSHPVAQNSRSMSFRNSREHQLKLMVFRFRKGLTEVFISHFFGLISKLIIAQSSGASQLSLLVSSNQHQQCDEGES